MARSDVLNMWVVYRHPVDYPDQYVARRHVAGSGWHGPTTEMFTANTLNEIRALLPYGLICTPRQSGDDPKIVEVWI